LNMMCDIVSRAFTHGLLHSERPWCREEKVKFLCPSPGYDRHFQIGQFYGAELITIPMLSTGPDMDMIEEYVKDPQVKMIWVVPKYSNPDGIIFSDETVKRFANLKPAAPDFAIIWDNAYCIHEFEGEYVPFPDIISLCEEAGRPDMVFEFASTSKITFAGGGTSCMAASEANIDYFTGVFGVQMISYDKVNQLRHVKYLKDKAHTLEIMKRHASVMAPKFRCVSDILEKEIKPLGFASWKRPTGGYFVSLNTMPGTAKRVWKLCKEAGVTMTNAGATFPYGIDPNDSNIRIAPSLPPVEELQQAMEVFTTCLKLAALEKLLNK
ncbi:MAG: aminotransferase class I/II-fold pyridoxal phosphate-dependent enzyme, partial [Oscillospiraceae bacterium]|nr:aminotransferase class I/II-fold pyridoxal phosphate-dependent enzyme [Oscillospiraceae bacterium]